MGARGLREAALQPGVSMLASLPGLWTVAPSDDGVWFLLGGDLPEDPDVLVRVELARRDGRDLGESVAWLLGELLAGVTAGRASGANLSEAERGQLSSQLRLLLEAGRDG